jgi:predicted unusual protein kinase regulating ubiquinone biosynthesis (AarF/ABC1/UbiB family)
LLSTGSIAASAARLAARRVTGRTEGERDGLLGEALARELDQMKGMAMKVGQIVSYFDGVLPEGAHEALRKLQKGVTPMRFDVISRAIEDSFGQPLKDLFDEFEPTPIAAASIGQVHRARFRDEWVAVKVQYPGIRDTMDADFRRLAGFSRLASFATAVDGPALVAELRARVHEECDYLREADHQRAWARAFANDSDVTIPAVIDERTTKEVLTTHLCTGSDFYGFAEARDSATKNAAAAVLVRFAYESLWTLAAVNADPHPGNYLFPESGGVVFLDFGCVRHFDRDWLAQNRRLLEVVIDDRRRDFDEALVAAGMVGTRDRFDFDHHWALLCHEYAPYRSARFRFTREWLKGALEFSKPSNPNLRRLVIPPPWIWLERLTWGLHAVLVRLEAEGSFGDLLRGVLAESPRELGCACPD